MMRWIGAGLVVAIMALAPTAPALAAVDPVGPDCDAGSLADATVAATLELDTDESPVRVVTQTTVTVSRAWQRSTDVLSDVRDPRRAEALACLFGPAVPTVPVVLPTVSVKDSMLTLRLRTERLLGRGSSHELGFWQLQVEGDRWVVRFAPKAPGLRQARWSSVELVTGEFRLARVSPTPTDRPDEQHLAWQANADDHGPPQQTIEVELRPDFRLRLGSWLWAHRELTEILRYLADIAPFLIGIALLLPVLRRAAEQEPPPVSTAVAFAFAAVLGADLLVLGLFLVRLVVRPDYHVVAGAGLVVMLMLAISCGIPRLPRSWQWWTFGAILLVGLANGALVFWLTAVSMGDLTATVPAATVAAGAVGMTQGLFGLAAVAGATWSILSAYDGKAARYARTILLVTAGLGAAVVIGQAVQRVLLALDWYADWAWAIKYGVDHSEGLLTLPWDLVAEIPFWPLLLVALLVVLRTMARADVRLIAFLFITGTVSWPDWYGLIPLPVGAFVTYFLLLALLKVSRKWTVAPSATDEGERRELIADSLDLEAAGRRPDADRQALLAKYRGLRERAGLGRNDRREPLDVALAQGPGRTWWENGVICGRATAVVSIPFAVVYLALAWRNAPIELATNSFAVINLFRQLVDEVSFWLIPGLVLGFLWHVLPGRRGYLKPLTLVAAYGLGAAVVQLSTGQGSEGALTIRVLSLFVVLTVAASWADTRQLRHQRMPWEGRFAALVAAYRLRQTGGTIVLVITQLAALVGIYQQLRSGIEPFLPTPPPGTGNR